MKAGFVIYAFGRRLGVSSQTHDTTGVEFVGFDRGTNGRISAIRINIYRMIFYVNYSVEQPQSRFGDHRGWFELKGS